jgi:soluble lytic murein transglycosylase
VQRSDRRQIDHRRPGTAMALALALASPFGPALAAQTDPVPAARLPAQASPAATDPVPRDETLPAPSPDASAKPPVDPDEAADASAPPPPPVSPARALFREAFRIARGGDPAATNAAIAKLPDALDRKIVQWALIDSAATRVDFATLDTARKGMEGWPRASRRQAGAEKTIETSTLKPKAIVEWFGGRDPDTPEGAMALAGALQASGRTTDAVEVIRHHWREHIFEIDLQSRMLARFGGLLNQEDHTARLATLLYGSQGPAARAMLDLVDEDHRVLAEARMALRAERSDAPEAVQRVPATLQSDPGLAFDRARFYRKRNLDVLAAGLVRYFPTNVPDKSDAAAFIWAERRALMLALIRSGDFPGAYAAADQTGLHPGPDLAEAEFYAGWIALQRLHDPVLADRHFAVVQQVAQSSVTVSRAYYWRARAAQARGDAAGAKSLFAKGAAYYTSFYGMLAAEAIGQTTLTIGHDPIPSLEDRNRFESREVIAAAHRLAAIGEREAFRAFVLAAAETSTRTEDYVQLVDLARAANDPDLGLRIARAGNYRGYYLPERGYPLLDTPQPPGAADPAFMLAITRQESSFDPHARSHVGARGLMQLMPQTAAHVARGLGMRYSSARLDDPHYNMTLGGYFLGRLTSQFGGSFVLAAAAYNAGPGRPADWVNSCGDPRKTGADPTDFIECIPFTETRNYVMRVMENKAIYRARLQGGSAPLTLAEDLRQGKWAPLPTIDSILSNISN